LKDEDFCTKIFSEKEGKKEIVKKKHKNSMKSQKYTIDYINKTTGKDEILNMNCSFTCHTCGIFNGKEKEGAPMIGRFCKIFKDEKKKNQQNFNLKLKLLLMLIF